MARIRLGRATAMMAMVGGLVLAACGGSTPTGPGPLPPPPPPTVTFVSDNADADDNSIVLVMTTTGADSFTLTLNAIGVTDLFGYALDIVFDAAIIDLESSQFGAFLNGEGVNVTSQITETPAGRLVAGHSRVGAVPGVTGTGSLMILNFTALTAGTTTTVAIENAGAFDGTGAMLDVGFVGGSITVPPAEQ